MRKLHLLLIIATALLGIVVTNPAFGSGKKKATPPPVSRSPVITSVSANTVTVTEEKTARTLTISQFTEITVNGQRATIADLKPGMIVSVTLGTDPSHASRINATGK
jgi:hypothetical protein